MGEGEGAGRIPPEAHWANGETAMAMRMMLVMVMMVMVVTLFFDVV